MTILERIKPFADQFHRFSGLLIVAWLMWLGISVGNLVSRGIPSTCLVPAAYLPNWSLATVGLVALVVGRYWNLLGKHVHEQDERRVSQVAGQLGMVMLFLALTVVWFLEALGTARVVWTDLGWGFQPITYYVRCAIFQDFASHDNGFLAANVIAALCFLAGHWLWSWHPKLRSTHEVQDEEAQLA